MSVEAIRFYEKAGVLAPAARDASGYRSYDEQALRNLVTVRWARELGFPLEAIAAFVRSDPGAAKLRVDQIGALIAERTAAIDLEIQRLRSLQEELSWLGSLDFGGECRLPAVLVDALLERHEAEAPPAAPAAGGDREQTG